MHPDRMRARGVDFESFEYGVLQHYRLRCNKISQKFRDRGFVNIEPCFEDNVYGVLYKLSPNANLMDLDKKEGYPVHYEKTFVPVHTAFGVKFSLVYVATRAWTSENDLPASEDYKNFMSSGFDNFESISVQKMSDDHKFYEDYNAYKERAWARLES